MLEVWQVISVVQDLPRKRQAELVRDLSVSQSLYSNFGEERTKLLSYDDRSLLDIVQLPDAAQLTRMCVIYEHKLSMFNIKLVTEFKHYLSHLAVSDRSVLIARLSVAKYPLSAQDRQKLSLYADALIESGEDFAATAFEETPWLLVERSLLRSYLDNDRNRQWEILKSAKDFPLEFLETVVTYTQDPDQLSFVYDTLPRETRETRLLMLNRHKDSVEQTAFILRFLDSVQADLTKAVFAARSQYANAVLVLAALPLSEPAREVIGGALGEHWI